MEISVNFNRPLMPLDLSQLISDMSSASNQLAIASAWFTDTEVADAFVASPSMFKTAIFNRHDVHRGDRKAVKIVRDHLVNMQDARSEFDRKLREVSARRKVTLPDDYDYDLIRSIRNENIAIALANLGIDRVPSEFFRFSIIGGTDWQEGVMHNKFIVADDVVWFGSFNFTFNARNNYETLVRISDRDVAAEFWNETGRLYRDGSVWYDGSEGNSGGNLSRCELCSRLFPSQEAIFTGSHGAVICIECDKSLAVMTQQFKERVGIS